MTAEASAGSASIPRSTIDGMACLARPSHPEGLASLPAELVLE